VCANGVDGRVTPSASKVSKPLTPFLASISRTTRPEGAPVAIEINARGQRRHHSVMTFKSTVASFSPRGTSGTLPFVGNTGQPKRSA